jgi:chemotaxis protein histidine kinase CheA
MSNVIKDSLSEGDIVNIPMSLTEEQEEEVEQEQEQEQEEDEEENDEEESDEEESDKEESDQEEEKPFIKPQVNQDIKEDKSKKKNNEELVSLFRENINKFDSNKLDKSKLEILEKNLNTLTDYKYFNNAIELLNAKELNDSNDASYKYLYPHLDDAFLNIKITNKQEFHENKLKIEIGEKFDFEKQSNEICNKDFELAPHQKFIKNFLSMNTPYNGLLLYHGLGTGKTCSAIGVAEETRKYLKFMGYNERIIIVASPNVQENFYLQLFDERKLEEKNGIWTINNCAGQNILDEINMIQKNLSRDKVIKIVKNIINNYYLFLGYTQFANLIIKKSNISNLSLSTMDSKKNNY